MDWENSVLRKYNSTMHNRLIKQLKSELKPNKKFNPGKTRNTKEKTAVKKTPFSEVNLD